MGKQVVFPFLTDTDIAPIGAYVINFKHGKLLSNCYAIMPSGADTIIGGLAQAVLLQDNPEVQDLWDFDSKITGKTFKENEDEFDILCEGELKDVKHPYVVFDEPQDLKDWVDIWMLNYPIKAKALLLQQRKDLKQFEERLLQFDSDNYQALDKFLYQMATTDSLGGCMQLTAECGVASSYSGRIEYNKNLKANIGKLIALMHNRNKKWLKLV